MAIIKCPECGKDISDKAKKCPNCGFPILKQHYKERSNNSIKQIKQFPEVVKNQIANSSKKTKIALIISLLALFFIIVALIVFAFVPLINLQRAAPKNIIKGQTINVGSTVTFGSYPFDENRANVPIEWIVIAKKDEKIQLLSKYTLDCQQFNSEHTMVDWETSSIRKWLNNDFYYTAFNKFAQKHITTTLVEYKSKKDETECSSDNVFLLSHEEAYQLPNKYFYAKATDYAVSQGVSRANVTFLSHWWSRTTYWTNYRAYAEFSPDEYYSSDYNVESEWIGVRPTLWVKIK